MKMSNRYKVTHSNKNEPGMSQHIFALIDTLSNNQVIKEDYDLHELMDICTEKNTIIKIDCHCGGKIEISRHAYHRLQAHHDVMCKECEGE